MIKYIKPSKRLSRGRGMLALILALLSIVGANYLQTTVGGGTGGGNAVGSTSSGVFNFANYGAIDDDTTDNCSGGTNAVALFTAAVNAYSGPGRPIAIIAEGASNKAYKLATASNSCTFAFTRTNGVDVHLWANLDCAQAAQSCIQLGPSGLSSEVANENYSIDGGGLLLNGANLTFAGNVAAGIYVEPGVATFTISHIQFGRDDSGSTTGFGAANATLGSCTNYAIYIDAPVATGWVDHVRAFPVSTGTTAGGCGFTNPLGSLSGSNTIFWEGTQCGSQGIIDGGTLGVASNNNIYGFGVPIRLIGIGHRMIGNQIDAAGCSAHGVGAAFQIGAAGSATAVGPITLDSNIVQLAGDLTTHTRFLVAIAGDSTATINGMVIIGNQNNLGAQLMMPTTLNCTAPVTSNCRISGNTGFSILLPTPTVNTGWSVPTSIVSVLTPATQTANLGSTLAYTTPATNGKNYFISCEITETVAGSSSSTLPSCQIVYTNGLCACSTTLVITATNTSNAVGATQSGTVIANVSPSTSINISTTGYASSAAGMTYQLQAAVETYQ
jgi:hypothetical protein